MSKSPLITISVRAGSIATVSVTAKMIQNGKLIEAKMDMTPEDFRQLRQDFIDNVEGGDEYDDVYTLTDIGKEIVNQTLGGDRE